MQFSCLRFRSPTNWRISFAVIPSRRALSFRHGWRKSPYSLPNLKICGRTGSTDFKRLLRTKWMDAGEGDAPNVNANVYSFVPYLASAAGIEMGKFAAQPGLVLLYCARVANLALYLALVYLALRIAPAFRSVVFCLALMPMALQQAASASADGPTIASAFLFFAYVLYLAFDPRMVLLSIRHVLVLAGLLLFTSLCKFNPWFSLLPLLIPASRFGGKARKVTTVGALLGMVLVASAVWQVADRDNLLNFQNAKTQLDIYMDSNVGFLLQEPAAYAAVLLRTWLNHAASYSAQFVGRLGPLSVPLPGWLIAAYLGLLVTAAVGGGRLRLTLADRLSCFAIAAGSMVSIFALLWVMEMHRPYLLEQVIRDHRGESPGVQGRYFVPFAPIFFLILCNTKIRLNSSILVGACFGMVLLSSCVALAAVHRAYYFPLNTGISRAGFYRGGRWTLDFNGSHESRSLTARCLWSLFAWGGRAISPWSAIGMATGSERSGSIAMEFGIWTGTETRRPRRTRFFSLGVWTAIFQ